MDLRLQQRWDRLKAFMSEGLWRQEFEPRTWTARGVALLRFAVVVVQGFVRDNLLLRASALTYFTVLSLVPVLAIVSSVVTALGVTENVLAPLFDQVAAVAPDVGDQLRAFVETANIAGLGTLGAVALVLTTLLGLSNVERALNHIWGVPHQRPWGRKLADYTAVMIVAPLLFGASLSVATLVRNQFIVQKLLAFPLFAQAYDLGLSQVPTLVLIVGFSFVYAFLPNTRVRPTAALLGGTVAAVAVSAALSLYVGLSVGATRANVLYGSFAQLPFFLVWVYVFWAIVLLGAEIAFAYQNVERYRREVRAERAGPAERELVGLRIAVEIARAFRDGRPPWTSDELADGLNVSVRTVRRMLATLQSAHIAAAVDGSVRPDGWQLGRPAERIPVVDVLAAVRGPREPLAGDPEARAAVESLLAEFDEGEAKAGGGRTLADVIAGIPERETRLAEG